MNIANYKACLFDLDRTLTNSQQEITPATAQALKKLDQKMKIGLCTGRHFSTLKNRGLSYFAPADTHIVSGGAQVITSSGEILWEKLIPLDLAKKLIQEVDNGEVIIYLQTRDQIYGNQLAREKWHLAQIGMNAKPILIGSIEDFPDLAVPHLVIKNISPETADYLLHHPDFNAKVMRDYDDNLYADVMLYGVNKTTGLKHWCQINQILPEEIIGFGDSENDEEFLSYVGYAVAMGNAVDSVKKIADEVIGSCDEDGIARWVKKT